MPSFYKKVSKRQHYVRVVTRKHNKDAGFRNFLNLAKQPNHNIYLADAGSVGVMESISFTPGHARLQSDSFVAPWRVLFEDEGPAGYFYVCNRSLGEGEESIIDSMLIYNVSALEDSTRERLLTVQWSRDGLQAVLYLDGSPQAMADFNTRESMCRTNFPNFLDGKGDRWRASSHAWNDEAIKRFEADIYQ